QHRLVHFPATELGLVGEFVSVRVTEALAHSVLGEVVKS
ncbi:MAG: TRAM domain-containing protein, partial [Planctomycetes bacterium]|nr:TRAM domain-containing protein [Planctomycetota bacterium]